MSTTHPDQLYTHIVDIFAHLEELVAARTLAARAQQRLCGEVICLKQSVDHIDARLTALEESSL